MTDAPPRPVLRQLPAPNCEPPYDDERGAEPSSPAPVRPGEAAPAGVQGTLALAFVLPSGVPSVPEAPPDLRLLPRLTPGAEEDLDAAEFGPQPTARADLPEPRRWAGRFTQAVVEVLAGDRPVGQLVRWTSNEVYDDLVTRAVRRRARGDATRAVVRSVHVAEPADGVVEVAAMVRGAARTTAVALRLEGLDGRWQCTAIELG